MTLARMGARRVALAAVAVAALGFGAIGCKDSGPGKADASDGAVLDGHGNADGSPGDGRDGGEVGPPCVAGAKTSGEACSCNAQCGSGFCVDGVCCTSACTEGCKTCAAPGTVGTCVNRSSGDAPRVASTCVKTAVSTCGADGTCDGSGACRKYPVNTMCKPGMCDGDAVVGSYACDGAGHCKPGATRICVPFSCNPNTGDCVDTCTTSSQCVTGQQCVAGSCGKRMKGSPCEGNDQCASNFCADKRLLQRRLPGRLRLLQPDGPRRDLLADRRRQARPAQRLPRRGAGELRSDGPVRRHRQLLEVRARHPVRGPDLHGEPPEHAGDV